MEEIKLAASTLPFTATIVKSHAKMKDRVTYYKLEAHNTITGEESSFVCRFSDVADLYDTLENIAPLANQLPPFPPRTAKDLNVNHLQAEFVDERVNQVNKWFQRLCAAPNILCYPELYQFFKFDDGLAKKMAEKQEKEKDPNLEFKISVPEAEVVGDGGTTYYTVKLTYAKDVKTLRKRFNDFKTLNTDLHSDYSKNSKHMIANFPPFPQSKLKLFTNHSDPGFIEERRQTLDNYLSKVTQLPRALTDIHLLEFLGFWHGYQ